MGVRVPSSAPAVRLAILQKIKSAFSTFYFFLFASPHVALNKWTVRTRDARLLSRYSVLTSFVLTESLHPHQKNDSKMLSFFILRDSKLLRNPKCSAFCPHSWAARSNKFSLLASPFVVESRRLITQDAVLLIYPSLSPLSSKQSFAEFP